MHTIELGQPSAKQREFFLARERFVAYGGARGGGKSWAVRKKAALLALRYGGIRILILRRTFPELRENHILPLRAELLGVADYKESEKSFRFPNGSRLKFGYCATESDVLQYQGQEYDVIFIDEATQFTEFQFSTLTACLRGANDFPKRMYLTCNPGGVGHGWVKRLFVERNYRGNERASDYRFIRAQVYDNRALLESDPGYLRMLENLPEDLRRAWLLGDWEVFAGQYFKMWDPAVHLLDPFPIPARWRRYLSLDYGLDMLAAYWIAVSEEGLAYVYREVYQSGLVISETAELLRASGAAEAEILLAPPDLWNRRQDTGKSVADIFAEYGLYLQKADNRRVQGWYDLAEWLRVRPSRCEQRHKTWSGGAYDCVANRRGVTGGSAPEQPDSSVVSPARNREERAQHAYSGFVKGEQQSVSPASRGVTEPEGGERYANLRIFKTCENLARCLPLLQFDAKNPNDVATEPHEITHGPDAIRYFVAGRPQPAEERAPENGGLQSFLSYGGGREQGESEE